MTVDDFRCFLGSKGAWALSLSAFVLGAYLLWTHTGHFVSALPYLIFLLCPLMHLFGHRHGHDRHREDHHA
jgi:hypothetical protein